MESPVSSRIPPPAWAGRPPLLRVLGERYVDAATLGVLGLVAGAAAVLVADDRLFPLVAIVVAAGVVGAVAARITLPDLRKAAAEAPVADEGPSRFADRGEYVIAAAPWHRVGALVALLALDGPVGEVGRVGHPVLVGGAGLMLGLGIAAWAGAWWVRRWERRGQLGLYLRNVPSPTPDRPVTSGKPPSPEETARVQRRLMSGQGLDDKDRDVLAWLSTEKARDRPPHEATSRRYVVVPHPGRAATGRPAEPSTLSGAEGGRPTAISPRERVAPLKC